MSPALRRLAAVAVLAPFLAGAHCNDACPSGAHNVAVRVLERTVYGPALITASPRVVPLADAFRAFDRRGIRLDVGRPVAVVLTRADTSAELLHVDGSKLRPGDRTAAFAVVGVVESAGRVPLLDGAGGLADAERAGYDAIVLVPRDTRPGPWEAAVTVEVGHTFVGTRENGACAESLTGGPPAPEWRLGTLPAHCGDGVRQDDEDCDDGNRAGGDGCGPYCGKER
jgi:cysteine-rich repeat protein